ncbi:MAG: CNNM domain-containing protein, partial [Pirellulales bacterium]
MIGPLLLLVLAVLLSAFFSGSETGFYRATRVRLVLDARRGDSIARGLLWLTNRPTLFVATTLVGNNVANWLASLAIVMGVHHLFSESSHVPEVIGPIVMAPVVFLYGELLPKHVFYLAPNRLLRRCGPLLLICTALFLPVSGLLWGISRILASLMGSSSRPVQLTLARRELQ